MKHDSSNKNIAVLGAGIAGLAASVRLANQGHTITVYEQSDTYGGKMGEWRKNGYRWDTGPSLFTMPEYVEDLLAIDGEENVKFEYRKLDTICKYFWNDCKTIEASADREKLLSDFESILGEPKENIRKFLKASKAKYTITNHVFLEKSLHKLRTYLSWGTIKSMLKLSQVEVFKNMNSQNKRLFKNPKTVQFFNRYATYNGSNPYKAPATLNVIPHYEFGIGAFFPEKGIRSIADAIYEKAVSLGVEFRFQEKVTDTHKIGDEYVLNNSDIYDAIVCNMDVASASRGPLKALLGNEKKYEPSSSALIFYWGMKKSFKNLDVHNIFFANDYKQEFEDIFENKTIHNDPTVYIHISSKCNKADAPPGCENWFVMVNASYDDGQDWDSVISEARSSIISKLSKILGTNIEDHIQVEHKLTPQLIESKTGSYKGALYGSSSNNRMAAFMRQPNFSSKHKGLYFCGGSVHPGGGIPLCLLSAKITSDIIKRDL